jgi:Fic family protein
MPSYQPPYQLTPRILQQVASICELLGRWSVTGAPSLSPHLRRDNRIRTIHASLAIEHNSLSLEQVSAVLDGKRVLGQPREIQEVRNAFAAYEQLPNWRPERAADVLAAHGALMLGLVDNPGQYRQAGVGIYRGEALVHMAPPASRVAGLMGELLDWLAATDVHPLIASCVFHYEFEFIHPFDDGNGRMGRMWQTLILSQWQPLLAYLPVETLVHARQADYYQALSEADRRAEATPFIEFMLQALLDAMGETLVAGSEKGSEESSEKILALLRAEPRLPARVLAERLGISPRAVEKQIAKLREQGRLRRIGAAKGGHWQVVQ